MCLWILCRTILVANNIQLLRKDSSPTFTGQDIAKIRKFTRQKNVVCIIVVCNMPTLPVGRIFLLFGPYSAMLSYILMLSDQFFKLFF